MSSGSSGKLLRYELGVGGQFLLLRFVSAEARGLFAAIVVATMAVSVQGFAPQASRVSSTKLAVVDDKTEVREYFNTEGFNRWNKIYSESDEVNTVQLDIRTGHGQTIQKILNWVDADGDINGKSVCDCGCGVGSLAIPLAQMGKFTVSK